MGIESALVEGGHLVAQTISIGGGKIGHRLDNPIKARSRHAKVTTGIDTRGNKDGIVFLSQIGECGIASNFKIEMESNAPITQTLGATFNDFLFKLEIGDAVSQQAADAIIAIINVHAVPFTSQFLRPREAGRTGTDNAHRLIAFPRHLDRFDPTFLPCGIGQILFNGTNSNRSVSRLFDHTIAFAETVLRANPATDLGHIVGRLAELVGFFETTFRRHLKPIGNIIM